MSRKPKPKLIRNLRQYSKNLPLKSNSIKQSSFFIDGTPPKSKQAFLEQLDIIDIEML